MLHVTNGDSAAITLRRTGVTGSVIAWRDILHEGPTPAGLALEGMSDVRARFLHSIGEGTFADLHAELGARDAAIRSARQIVLWFEHDLYDQLQLIQILATLAMQPETVSELISISSFAGVEPFHGLGQLSPTQLASLWPLRRRVNQAQLAVGARAWKAFCSPNPLALQNLITADTSALPFLRDAMVRHLEEFPSSPDGLPRTERQLLRAAAAGHHTFEAIFRANQDQETAPFMGDTVVRQRIDVLTNARVPLLTREPYRLTPAGERVLAGESDARQLNGIDRWLGGVHLQGRGPVWRWHQARGTVVHV
jgi:hypothetical protein